MTDEVRARSLLNDEELLIYATVKSREPMRLPPLQVARLHRILDSVEGEKPSNGKAWRVNRESYGKRRAG